MRVWDSETGTELHQVEYGGNWFRFSPKGQFLASKINQTLIISDPQTGKEIFALESENYFIGDVVAFSPDETMLVTSEGEIWGISG